MWNFPFRSRTAAKRCRMPPFSSKRYLLLLFPYLRRGLAQFLILSFVVPDVSIREVSSVIVPLVVKPLSESRDYGRVFGVERAFGIASQAAERQVARAHDCKTCGRGR